MKEKAVEGTQGPQQILLDAAASVSEHTASQMPPTSTLRRTIRKQRQQSCNPYSVPATREDVVIPGEYTVSLKQESFVAHDSGFGDRNRILVFATQRNLDCLSRSKAWFMDGTFKVTPSIFFQVYTVHGMYKDAVIPLVYALLPNKTEETYQRDCSLTDILQEDGSQISVATGGKFPCLHIAISGLLEDRRYLLALDFCEMFTDRDQRFLTFTEPYYMPRPNHLEGRDWMKRVLYFNLTSIVNGGLQESGMTLTSNCEYLPTLRIMGSGHGAALSSSPVVRFALKKSELLAVSLKSAVPNSMRASARQFLLVRRYVMKSGTFCKEDLVPTSGPRGNQRPKLSRGQPRSQPAGVRSRFPPNREQHPSFSRSRSHQWRPSSDL
ncbi:uncharacterized protein ISCGN_026587 [Ixodes scapularis]